MKSFLIKFGIITIIVSATTLGLKILFPTVKNYNSAMVDKLDLLKKNKSKQKILLIGGSSVGWGLSAELIEKATNITTINLGHHIGFGLVDFQEFIISCLTPNDIIIFSPEWKFYTDPTSYDPATFDDLCQNKQYLEQTNKPLKTSIKSIILKKIYFHKPNDKKTPYRYDCINQNGDVISHCGLIPKGLEKYSVQLEHFDQNLFINTFQYISKTKCILLFPPTQKSIYQENKKSFDELQALLSKSNLNYLDSISSNVYDEVDFFDKEYHLKCEIKMKRSEKVISYILNTIRSSK
jgi:hypothetical protein